MPIITKSQVLSYAIQLAILRRGRMETAPAGWGGRIRTLESREAASRTWLDRNGGAIGAPDSLQNGLDWVQVTLWQLSRENSLIAKRSEMKGNSGHQVPQDYRDVSAR
jgi:hypothetical protein